jgi:DNA-binding transcriptional MerR regulator
VSEGNKKVCFRAPHDYALGAMLSRWATTEEVATAAGITGSAVMKWAGKHVLPAYTVIYGGRRGRSARWPLHAVEQASWVRGQLDAGLSFEEIREMLERGEFKPSST